MLINVIRVARVAVRLLWLTATVGIVGLAALPHIVPALGREMYVVRGASMQPAIPVGAVILVRHVEPTAIEVGDIITFRAPNQTLVTHRVVGISSTDEITFATKGDGSSAADAIVVSSGALVGRVETFVPHLGVVISVLASTLGAVAALGVLGGLLLAVIFMDALQATVRRSTQRRTALTEPAY